MGSKRNKRINDQIRAGAGMKVVTDTDSGKAARKGPEGVQPEDKEAKPLEDMETPELFAELSDSVSKVQSALDAVTAINEELAARLEEEGDAGEEEDTESA